MQAIRSKGTSIEKIMGKALWAKGLRYRKNDKTVFGYPDFTFKSKKIAIFCDSEFWHGKDWETKKLQIKTNKEFWIAKIERNIARDLEVNTILKEQGWIVLRFWEKEIKKDIEACINNVLEACNLNKPDLS